jgi:T5SS/PEP-CTERM-associated repeat protein
VFTRAATIGTSGTSNYAVVTGTGSLWAMTEDLTVGNSGISSLLLVTNGAGVFARSTVIGSAGGQTNRALIAGAGSLLSNQNDVVVGRDGSFNALSVTDGGTVLSRSSIVGSNSFIHSNLVLVTGGGSLWSNSSSLTLGLAGAFNSLLVSNGGTVHASNFVVGVNALSTNNLARVTDGSLIVTPLTGEGTIDLRRGELLFDGGLIDTHTLVVTNGAQSTFTFKSGTLTTRATTVTNGSTFFVGDGTGIAQLNLAGTTSNHFFGNGLTIRANAQATLSGGTLTSPTNVTIETGGTLLLAAHNRIAAGTPLHLAGGTFNLASYTQTAALGALTLSATSTLDFGAPGTGQILTFSSLASHTGGSLWHIQNWEGTPAGGGTDQIKFADLGASLTAGFLADVRFSGHPPGAALLGTGEIVPVPEPASVIAGLALGGLILAGEWRRRARQSA